jgi:asparagine synthase (glutamine-hydrolysing)
MCGILGFIGGIDEINFKNSLDKISHRGPDGWGIWSDDNIKLGHRRLSIIDLSDNAKQPFEVLNRYSITFNGEIYNYLELKIELQKIGYVFKSNSDTEVVLYSYIAWGVECLKKFNGMWAFAIWDKQEKSLFLTRDRIGKKPLFYHKSKNKFIFCSEMKGIYKLVDSITLNFKTINSAIENSFSYENTSNCLFNEINRFPAGSYGYYKNNTLEIVKYWDVLDNLIELPKKYNEQVEYFKELFFDACKIRMRSDVTIGTALSGGLDSSSVICTMSHLSKMNNDIQKDWQHAFVASFPGSSIDETEYALKVTNHLGIKADFLKIDPTIDIDNIFYNTYLFEELFFVPTIPFIQLYGNIKKNGVTVSIDGHGADELFAGYPFKMFDALPDTLPNLIEFWNVLNTIDESEKASIKTAKSQSKELLKFALINKYPFFRNFVKDKTNMKLLENYNNIGFLNSNLYEQTYQTILPTLLRNYDRYSMINGVEIRMPFLDYRIQQFAFSIPYSSKIRNGYGKSIIRDAMKGIVPDEIIYRKDKIGFNSPMESWLNKDIKIWVNDQIHSKEFLESKLIDGKKVQKHLLTIINKEKINFIEGNNAFSKLMPYIWEKSLKYIN